MSKITKALEKAARERLQKMQARPTAKAQPVEVAIETPQAHDGEIVAAGRIAIDPHIVAATDPNSPIAEQYRILRTNLQSLQLPGGSKVIVVTSAVNNEGKSVTALNLALTLARQEQLKVVLVDADFRKSSVSRWLGLERGEDGLSGALLRGGELNGDLVTLKEPPLTVLMAGPHPEHPSELLESASMKRLLATLKARFDMVIVDAPPVLPVADPGIIAAHADGVLLVVRAGKTQRKTVVQAQALLKQMRANLLGCVLTHVEYYMPGYGYRYGYRYGYGSKESRKSTTTQSKTAPSEQADSYTDAAVASPRG